MFYNFIFLARKNDKRPTFRKYIHIGIQHAIMLYVLYKYDPYIKGRLYITILHTNK